MVLSSRPIVLLTDFGRTDAYVGVMKGVILSVNPDARIVDLSHEIDPQNLAQASLVLRSSIPYFPAETIFVCVVDPGVGTGREIVCVQTRGATFLAPDNGLLSFLGGTTEVSSIHSVNRTEYFRTPVSATFHGRDIFAPVAAHLSLGVKPEKFGPRRERLTPAPERTLHTDALGTLRAEVITVDRFGNLITNLPAEHLPEGPCDIRLGRRRIRGLTHTYGAAKRGALIALIGSAGTLEIAVAQGSAARVTRAKPGDPVTVHR